MEVEQLAIASLKPAPYNPRRISKHDMAALERSLAEFGAVDPAVVNADGTIIGGHMRVEAAKRLGWTEFPSVRVDLDEDKARLLNLALNRISGEWDEDMLAELIWSLHEADADLPLSGFDDKELRRIISSVGPVPEEVLEPPADPETRPGDLWLLGRHRLFCGDATNASDVERLLDGAKPALCVTDPPYGVDYDPAWRDEAARKGLLQFGAARSGVVPSDTRADWGDAWALFPGDVLYCWHAGLYAGVVQESLSRHGLETRAQIVWSKPHFAIGRGHYHTRHEPCWYAVRKGAQAHWVGDRKQTTVWEVTLDQNVEGGHSTQKPVELMERAIHNHEGDVYDPFVGSGTTLIAAERQGRTCYALDIDPGYCDVVVRRWETYAGEKARTEDGRTLSEPVPAGA